jgi:sialic acid synthase SpsE
MNNKIFEDLFVLELANNHWGDVKRGLKIIDEFALMVKNNNVKASIKLQLRDVDNLIHPDHINSKERYICKTKKTKLSKEEFKLLIKRIRENGCIAIVTTFDEKSVDLAIEMKVEIIKIASSDINDFVLLNKILTTKIPVIVSSGGACVEEIDNCVNLFVSNNIPIAINHCVSLYPCEDSQLDLNQIEFLKNRYPNLVIGFSTHEYHDWHSSMLISYAKGARTWERHIDIDDGKYEVSKYCSLPHQIDEWFKSYHKAKEMCGTNFSKAREITDTEKLYLQKLHRGFYFKRDIKAGENVTIDDLYLAIPILKNQISGRELLKLPQKWQLKSAKKKNEPFFLSDL